MGGIVFGDQHLGGGEGAAAAAAAAAGGGGEGGSGANPVPVGRRRRPRQSPSAPSAEPLVVDATAALCAVLPMMFVAALDRGSKRELRCVSK